MYLYEMHCHNSAVSACGRWSPEEMVEFYTRQGYSGIVVTDHFMNGNCKVDRGLPWKEQIQRFCSGYERARAAGERCGLDVFFGFEYTANTYYKQPQNPLTGKDSVIGTDFLIYGLDKEWLLNKDEDILCLPVNEFLKLVREDGGTAVQAHPFRLEKSYMDHISLFPNYTDGIEIINANSNTLGRANRLAMAYAGEYGFFPTAGSDAHAPQQYLAATQLDERVSTLDDLLGKLKRGDARLSLIESKKANLQVAL